MHISHVHQTIPAARFLLPHSHSSRMPRWSRKSHLYRETSSKYSVNIAEMSQGCLLGCLLGIPRRKVLLQTFDWAGFVQGRSWAYIGRRMAGSGSATWVLIEERILRNELSGHFRGTGEWIVGLESLGLKMELGVAVCRSRSSRCRWRNRQGVGLMRRVPSQHARR